jgi:RimJ/RimL family protein N-acetyltransferase
MNIHGKHVLLRAIEEADLPKLQAWANEPEIQTMLGGWHFPTSARDQQAWLASLSCQSTHQRFAIEVGGAGGLIGTANLVSIDWKNRNAFHGMLLGEHAARGKGFAVDTVMAVMRYAFDELGLERLDTDIIEYNAPSLRLYTERCGWTRDGVRPRAYWRKGRWWDKVLVGITRERYLEHAAATKYWSE